MLIAAIDQGSSSTKGALFAADGRVVARARVAVSTRREGDRVEHEPEALLASVRAVLVELGRAGRPDALALCCQRSTCLLWERASGRALTAALSWQDRRATAQVEALAADAAEVERRSGLRLTAYYAGPKLAWLLAADATARRRAEAGEVIAGTLDAFLVQRLTGAPATEPGHAGRTLLYGLEADAWDGWAAARFGVPAAALPELRPSVGAWGDVEGVPLRVVLGDQQAALVGNGGEAGRVVTAHFGTGAFVLADVGEHPRRHPGLLAAVTWSRAEGRRCQLEGSVNSAGSAVDWAARLAGVELAVLREGELVPEDLPWCVPGFVGVAAPWWRATPGAVLAGLRLEHDGLAVLRGTLAGVVLRVVDCVEALRAAGLAVERVSASGRLATLPPVAQLLADAAGVPVTALGEEEAGLRGAAALAAASLGLGAWPAPDGTPFLPRWDEGRRRRVRARWGAVLTSAAVADATAAEGFLG